MIARQSALTDSAGLASVVAPMSSDVLILAPHVVPAAAMKALCARYGSAVLVDFHAEADASPPAPAWQLVRSEDLFDADAAREDFLGLLESWPRRPLLEGQSFDDLFRHVDDYSVWWVGPGSSRQPT